MTIAQSVPKSSFVASLIGTTTGTVADGGALTTETNARVAGDAATLAAANAAAASAAPVQTVAGRTGHITLSTTDIAGFASAVVTASPVQTVAGRTGAVTLSHTDISDFNAAASAAAPVQPSAIGTTIAPLTAGLVPLANLPASVIGSNHYLGTWNAATNTPTLASGTAPTTPSPIGSYYVTSTAGTPTIDGVSVWAVGDWIVWDGARWDKVSGQANPVSSVAGRQGAVTLGTSDISGFASAAAAAAPVQTVAGRTGGVVITSADLADKNAANGFVGLGSDAATPGVALALSAATAIATGSSTARALGVRLADGLYAKDYGCPGDGTDQHIALAAFFTYCAAQGKCARFSAGTYASSVTLQPGVPILGDDQATCILKGFTGLTGHFIRIPNGTTGFYLRNMTVDANAQNISGVAHAVAFGSASYTLANVNTVLSDITVKNSGLCGIYTEGMNGLICRNITIASTGVNSVAQSSTSGQGMSLDGSNILLDGFNIQNTAGCAIGAGTNTTEAFTPLGFISIRNGYIYNSGTAILEDNITAYSSGNVRVFIDNVRCNTSANHNIHVGGDGASVTNCRCENPTYNNIYMSCRTPGTSTYVAMNGGHVSGNTCINAGSGWAGIYLLYVQGGFVTDNDVRTATSNGIEIDTCVGTVVQGNSVNGYGTYGIVVLGGVRVSVTNNYVNAGASSATASAGLRTGVSSNSTQPIDNVFAGNKMATPGIYGIFSTDTPTGNRFMGNRIAGATTNDLNILAADFNADNQGTVDALGVTYGFSSKAANSTAIAYGYQNVAQNSYDIVFGRNNLANGTYSSAFGTQASTKGRLGAMVRASGFFTQQGDAQAGNLLLRGRTGAGTSVLLTGDGSGAETTINSFPTGNNNTVIHIKCKAVAVNSNSLASASFDGFLIEVKRGTSASTTTATFLTGSGTATATTGTWPSTPSLTLAVDTTNGCPKLTFNGPTDSWCLCECSFVEITYVPGT